MDYVFPSPPAAVLVAGGNARFPVRRVYCVGRNYAEHAKEMGFTGREDPFFFCKPADAILSVGDGATGEMPYPPKTANLHYEMELVVVLGKGGRDLTVEQADECVWGYALGLDMTRRDLQGEAKKQGRPWKWARLSISRRRSAPSIRAAPSARWTKAPSGWTSMASASNPATFRR